MKNAFLLFQAIVLIVACGCGSSPPPLTKATPHADHDVHPSEGPHGGSLIELGNDEYHAELVHDDAAKSVTIYLLDSAAKASVPIDATELIINLKHEGHGEQFKIAASADAGDPAGKSSRFVSSDAELAEDLDREDAEPQLTVKINGKQYRGMIEHGHSVGEAHQHEGDDALVWGRSDIKQADYAISLGHHGKVLHAGESVEPAVSITRDGKPVSEVQVYNSLWSEDGKNLLAKEIPTIYEPTTEEEPAHYAQGDLNIPSDAKNIVIRYRIVLPADAGEASYDLPVVIAQERDLSSTEHLVESHII